MQERGDGKEERQGEETLGGWSEGEAEVSGEGTQQVGDGHGGDYLEKVGLKADAAQPLERTHGKETAHEAFSATVIASNKDDCDNGEPPQRSVFPRRHCLTAQAVEGDGSDEKDEGGYLECMWALATGHDLSCVHHEAI